MNKVTKIVLQDVEKKIAQGKFTPKLSKVEGILASVFQIKHDFHNKEI